MSVSVSKGIWFFRLQIDIPPNGNLQGMIIQLCAKQVFYETNPDGSINYDKMVAETPEIAILTFPSLAELEIEFPGVTELMGQLQAMAITKGLQMMEARLNPPASDPVESPVPVPESGV